MTECGGTWTVERLSTGAESRKCRRRPVVETKALEKVEVFDLPGTASGVLRRCRGYVRDTPPEVRRLHALLLLFAKRRVAIHWGKQRVPAVRDWLADVT
ncbi:hypothetical protein NDU88_006449 [Pleurodeles waltl]|uniref:Uncharacterized protein n=1 Tax=Pleurodeles waltl TaxID=8319 RepID=A0AAV7MDG3_PLEWA|nr:hypothetical protein NDU88_006449 [Pleurodeles waltl]